MAISSKLLQVTQDSREETSDYYTAHLPERPESNSLAARLLQSLQQLRGVRQRDLGDDFELAHPFHCGQGRRRRVTNPAGAS